MQSETQNYPSGMINFIKNNINQFSKIETYFFFKYLSQDIISGIESIHMTFFRLFIQ